MHNFSPAEVIFNEIEGSVHVPSILKTTAGATHASPFSCN